MLEEVSTRKPFGNIWFIEQWIQQLTKKLLCAIYLFPANSDSKELFSPQIFCADFRPTRRLDSATLRNVKIESRNTYLRPGADSRLAHTARSSGQQRFPRMHRFSIRSPSPLRAVVIIANCNLYLPRGIIYVRATERFANPVSSSSLCSSGFSDRRHYRPLSIQVGCALGENQNHLLFRLFDQDWRQSWQKTAHTVQVWRWTID